MSKQTNSAQQPSIVMTLEHNVSIWKYPISGNKFGYYVATQEMTAAEAINSGCTFPRLDSHGRITSLQDAILWAQDRVQWVRQYVAQSSKPQPRVVVLNGPVLVF